MKIDYRQPFELRSSVLRMIFLTIISAFVLAWLGLAYHGDIGVMRGFEKGTDSESFAGFLLLIMIPFVGFQAYKAIKMNPLRPSLILSPEGIVYRGFSSVLVPWKLIAAIDVRHVEVRGRKWNVIELTLSDGISENMGAASLNSPSTLFQLGVHHISIPTYKFAGRGSGEIVAIIRRYHDLYGTHAPAPVSPLTGLRPGMSSPIC